MYTFGVDFGSSFCVSCQFTICSHRSFFLVMASLDDDYDDFFDSALLQATLQAEALLPGAVAATPASSRSNPTSTRSGRSSLSGASGEYNAFSFVGQAVTGGNGKGGKRSLYFFKDDPEEDQQTCLGLVGNNGKFCTKALKYPSRSCGIPIMA